MSEEQTPEASAAATTNGEGTAVAKANDTPTGQATTEMKSDSLATQLEEKIIRQVEYYFGDRNLPRDKFLQSAAAENEGGWVPVVTLLTFNRLKALSSDADVIVRALRKSTSGVLEVNMAGDSTASKEKTNPLECDIVLKVEIQHRKSVPKALLEDIYKCQEEIVSSHPSVQVLPLLCTYLVDPLSNFTSPRKPSPIRENDRRSGRPHALKKRRLSKSSVSENSDLQGMPDENLSTPSTGSVSEDATPSLFSPIACATPSLVSQIECAPPSLVAQIECALAMVVSSMKEAGNLPWEVNLPPSTAADCALKSRSLQTIPLPLSPDPATPTLLQDTPPDTPFLQSSIMQIAPTLPQYPLDSPISRSSASPIDPAFELKAPPTKSTSKRRSSTSSTSAPRKRKPQATAPVTVSFPSKPSRSLSAPATCPLPSMSIVVAPPQKVVSPKFSAASSIEILPNPVVISTGGPRQKATPTSFVTAPASLNQLWSSPSVASSSRSATPFTAMPFTATPLPLPDWSSISSSPTPQMCIEDGICSIPSPQACLDDPISSPATPHLCIEENFSSVCSPFSPLGQLLIEESAASPATPLSDQDESISVASVSSALVSSQVIPAASRSATPLTDQTEKSISAASSPATPLIDNFISASSVSAMALLDHHEKSISAASSPATPLIDNFISASSVSAMALLDHHEKSISAASSTATPLIDKFISASSVSATALLDHHEKSISVASTQTTSRINPNDKCIQVASISDTSHINQSDISASSSATPLIDKNAKFMSSAFSPVMPLFDQQGNSDPAASNPVTPLLDELEKSSLVAVSTPTPLSDQLHSLGEMNSAILALTAPGFLNSLISALPPVAVNLANAPRPAPPPVAANLLNTFRPTSPPVFANLPDTFRLAPPPAVAATLPNTSRSALPPKIAAPLAERPAPPPAAVSQANSSRSLVPVHNTPRPAFPVVLSPGLPRNTFSPTEPNPIFSPEAPSRVDSQQMMLESRSINRGANLFPSDSSPSVTSSSSRFPIKPRFINLSRNSSVPGTSRSTVPQSSRPRPVTLSADNPVVSNSTNHSRDLSVHGALRDATSQPARPKPFTVSVDSPVKSRSFRFSRHLSAPVASIPTILELNNSKSASSADVPATSSSNSLRPTRPCLAVSNVSQSAPTSRVVFSVNSSTLSNIPQSANQSLAIANISRSTPRSPILSSARSFTPVVSERVTVRAARPDTLALLPESSIPVVANLTGPHPTSPICISSTPTESLPPAELPDPEPVSRRRSLVEFAVSRASNLSSSVDRLRDRLAEPSLSAASVLSLDSRELQSLRSPPPLIKVGDNSSSSSESVPSRVVSKVMARQHQETRFQPFNMNVVDSRQKCICSVHPMLPMPPILGGTPVYPPCQHCLLAPCIVSRPPDGLWAESQLVRGSNIIRRHWLYHQLLFVLGNLGVWSHPQYIVHKRMMSGFDCREVMPHCVVQKGFDVSTSLDDIQGFFDQYGELEHVQMRRLPADRTFKGSVFAEFKEKEKAVAFLELATIEFQGKELYKESREAYGVRKTEEKKKEKASGKEGEDKPKEEETSAASQVLTKDAVLFFKGVKTTTSRENIKEELNAHATVAFIDFSIGDSEGHVRFDEEGGAPKVMAALKEAAGEDGAITMCGTEVEIHVLQDEEEEQYWAKKAADNMMSRRGGGRRKRGRGRGGRGGWGGDRKRRREDNQPSAVKVQKEDGGRAVEKKVEGTAEA